MRERLRGWMSRAALNAAAHDTVLTERFFRVSNFVDPPSRLQDPALIPRIVWGNMRARFAHKRTRAVSAALAPQRQALSVRG